MNENLKLRVRLDALERKVAAQSVQSAGSPVFAYVIEAFTASPVKGQNVAGRVAPLFGLAGEHEMRKVLVARSKGAEIPVDLNQASPEAVREAEDVMTAHYADGWPGEMMRLAGLGQ